jgi:nucleoside phosphorylase
MDPLANKDYTIGWICALPLEMAAGCAILDTNHGQPTEQHAKDGNAYSLGSIGKHNIVITCLPLGIYGINSAAVVVDQMLFSFPSIRFAFMVGIGGGIPSGDHDIRLGDVIVSVPDDTFGGVVQYDYGKTVAEGKLTRTGVLNKPPLAVLKAVSRLQMEYEFGRSKIPQYLSDTFQRHTDPNFRLNYSYQGAENDILYEAKSTHVGHGGTGQDCDGHRIVPRPLRENNDPVVHYGIIASGNQVMKDAETRDRIGNELGALCFEMEAAGLMDNFPCLVVRGICDYSDRHKNKRWQRYAAITAAAYAKELLGVITPHQVDSMSTAIEALKGG